MSLKNRRELAARIRFCLQETGYTSADLARGLDVTPQAVSQWITKEGNPTRPSDPVQLANLFNVNVGWLLTGEGPREEAVDMDLETDSTVLMQIRDHIRDDQNYFAEIRDQLKADQPVFDEMRNLLKRIADGMEGPKI